MRRLSSLLLACCTALLLGGITLAEARSPCFDPFPFYSPQHPGACFLDTDLGVFLNLDDGDEFVQVETFGDSDDFLRWREDGSIHSHQSELEATLFYCPPGVTGINCTFGFGLPGFDAWPGEGQWYVNSEINASFEFTCPSLIVGHGTVTDPESGDRYSIRTRMVRIKTPQGTCRDIWNQIDVRPLAKD